MTLAHAPVTFALGVCPSQGHTFASTHTPWQLHLYHDCRHHIQLMASTAPQATLPSLTSTTRIRSDTSASTVGTKRPVLARPAVRDISTSREHDHSQLFAPTIAHQHTAIHPKRRPPITPTCLSTLGHAFGKGLHHNWQAEGLIYAQIVSSPQLQLIKSIASILMHQLHPQYQQDRW